MIEGGFDDLFNETYTARMEEELDEIEEGKLKWTEALAEFYDKFSKDLAQFETVREDGQREGNADRRSVPEVRHARHGQKFGRFGKYLKCQQLRRDARC